MLWPLTHNSDCELHPLDSEFFLSFQSGTPQELGRELLC